MAINPFTYQQPRATTADIDWSPLTRLGDQWRASQEEQAKREVLSQLGPDMAANSATLLRSGIPELSRLGLQLQQTQTGYSREDVRNAILDKRADRQLTIQENQDRRAQEASDEDTPTARAQKVIKNGGDPKDPRYRDWIITGERIAAPQPTFEDEVARRKRVAETELGLKPGDPNYAPFIATGNWPKETQSMTAGEKTMIEDTDNLVRTGEAAIASLQRAKTLSSQAYEGPGAGAIGYGTSFLGKDSRFGKAGIATENLNNEVLSNALSQLKAIFGAAPTEGERKILLELQGSVNKSDDVRQGIYDRAIAAGNLRIQQNRAKAKALRDQTYFKPGGGDASTTGPQSGSGAVTFDSGSSDPMGLRK